MNHNEDQIPLTRLATFEDFLQQVDYSFMDTLNADPESTADGRDHELREVYSGHYVPVRPTPIANPKYIAHSEIFFEELRLSDDLVHDERFAALFSGDMSAASSPMRPFGWATGYALSIYGTEYTQQCPFRTGNGYGDGRAISIFEGIFEGKRWELQLKGSGPTPYCRGADGRAVLRSSVREFLAQEYMHALGIPTSRSLTLYMSQSEYVHRPWYSQSSRSFEPDIMTENIVAISTRVAPSFIRVGQLELFARRARNQVHPQAHQELKMIVQHLIERNYRDEIDPKLDFIDQVLELALLFRNRLISLVAHWLRVGYCQGNFNSDNCAAGGFTLDYGPFGFCELFHPRFQPWTGGGDHFSFFNQPAAAESNYHMFYSALRVLLGDVPKASAKLKEIREGFMEEMKRKLDHMWAKKLGLHTVDPLFLSELFQLMIATKVDYTLFFSELSRIPREISSIQRSFYASSSAEVDERWSSWFHRWHDQVVRSGDLKEISESMKQNNPRVAWREWLIAPAYQQAEEGSTELVHELKKVFRDPYRQLSPELATKYDRLRPLEFFNKGGVSHYSCSS